jgi:DNA-binding beta-propeller fold protein YncE
MFKHAFALTRPTLCLTALLGLMWLISSSLPITYAEPAEISSGATANVNTDLHPPPNQAANQNRAAINYDAVFTLTNASSAVQINPANTSLTLEPRAYLPLVMHNYPPQPGVELSPNTAVQNDVPGGLVTYALALANTGNVADSFYLTVTSADGPEWLPMTPFTKTDTLPPGGTVTVIISVHIPTTAAANQGSAATVTATSATFSNVSDVSVLVTFAQTSSTYTCADCLPQSFVRIRTGPKARGVALDTAGHRAFVAHANGVAVIDTENLAVVAQAPLSSPAHGIAYDPDNNRIWVSLIDADRLVVLDGETYATLADLETLDMPYCVAYNPTNHRFYVSNYGSDLVKVFNANTMRFEQALTDGFRSPAHIAVNPTTNKIYVANHRLHGQVTVIDGVTHETRSLYARLFDAYGITVDTTHNLIYAASVAEGRLSVIDGATEQVLGYLHVRRYLDGQAVRLYAIAVNPDVGAGESHLMLVTQNQKDEVGQLLIIPMAASGWPPLSDEPTVLDISPYPKQGIVVNPTTDRAWVTSVEGGLVNVVQDGLPVCPAGVKLYIDRRDLP